MSQYSYKGHLSSIDGVQAEIAANDHLFGEYPMRAESPNSPHTEMKDIWVRYGDIARMMKTGDFSGIADEHDSIWLKDLPEVKKACFEVMRMVDGERLGGVLITKLPPGGKIAPHTDSGWHAAYYDKFYVPIENKKGAVFGFESGEIDGVAGDVWQFDNSRLHWVDNGSDSDRIAMVICIKQGKYPAGGG